MIILQKMLIVFLSFFVTLFGNVIGTNFMDTTASYKERVKSVDFYENTLETAVPMTAVHDIIIDHFNSDLPEGKTEKKCIVIGYDGCRADALALIDKDCSGITAALGDEGTAVIAYCGGVPFPYFNTQDTSTAPGWCSMLTGQWADVHGITANDIPKSNDCLTPITTLVEDGTVDSSAFYVSWGGHFSGNNATYINELNYVKDNGINSTWIKAADDNGTKANVMADVTKADCSDFIFSIFEYCDHVGHDTGFSPKNPEYAEAFADAEATSLDIVNAIKSRETYNTEDWLIIFTSDHGGNNSWHGSFSIQERHMFIITNKPVEYSFEKTGAVC